MRRLLTTYTALLAGSVIAQPMSVTLEDFEGELVGWPSGVELVAEAKQGQHALRWQPQPADAPQALNFRFETRGIEMGEWDRLLFDYCFEGPGGQWWGVKIVDFPMGQGMQCTWQLADAKTIQPGEWQTAEVDLRHPMWLWGDKPDQTGQYIVFRYQGKAGPQPAVLLDNIRVVRDPVHVEGVEQLGVSETEGVVTGRWEIALRNVTATPVRAELVAREVTEGITVNIPTGILELPGETVTRVPISLAVRTVGEGALARLTIALATVNVRLEGMVDMQKSVNLSLAVPLGKVEHPCLLLTRADVPTVLARVEADEDCKAVYESLKKSADGWLTRIPEYPDRGSQWWHWYTCKACGARLTTKSDTEHVCPDCGTVYTGWPYDDVVLDRKHGALANGIRDCGLMYVLTGERAYAQKAREILLGYAERYLNYPLHNIHGKPEKGGGHVGPQTLDEATWLIPVAQGFDCIYDTLSEEDIRTIADKLLLPAAWLIHDHQWGIHNICCWHDSAYGLVGLTLGENQLAAEAINGPKGFRAQIEQGVTEDGFWYESAWGYHFYTMSALQPLAVAARHVGIDLYTQRYKSMYDAPLRFMAPGGQLAAFNDSGTANVLSQGRLYEIAYARWGDARHLLPILESGRRSLERLLYGAELGVAEHSTLSSTVFPAAGYVILRSGALGETAANRYIPENYVALDYGPHGGGHGHPDKLGFVLYGKGTLLAEDPGSIAYGNPAHGGWFRQTLSHNTIVVDGKSQQPCTGMLQFAAFGDDIGLCSVRADQAYPGVRLRRSLALVGDRVIDIVLCEANNEHQYELAYHNRGILESALPFTALAQVPEGDGYSWAKEWRSAPAPHLWRAVWQQEGGPTVTLVQAAAEGKREVLTAIGMGNPTRIRVPFIVSRQQGQSALFCTALAIGSEGPQEDLTIRVLEIVKADASDERPVAVEVTGGGIRDIVLVNPGGGVLHAEGFELVGQGAVLHYQDDELEQILVGDAQVRVVDK
ncbi:MAG: heparinase II/III domain-containing protein [Candidatus Zipacnadales bacterium]